MPIKFNNIRKLYEYKPRDKPREESKEVKKARVVGESSIKTSSSFSKGRKAAFKAAAGYSDKLRDTMIGVFSSIFGKKQQFPEPEWGGENPIFDPGWGTENPLFSGWEEVHYIRDFMSLFAARDLDVESRDEIEDQIKMGLDYLKNNGDRLRQQANESGKPLYIRPGFAEGYEGGKIGTEISWEARYSGSHIQVNPDGTIYLIPKHPRLTLGKGTFKRVRTAIFLDENNHPRRLVAFASVNPDEKGSLKNLSNEINTIQSLLQKEKPGEDIVDVGIQVYEPGEISEKQTSQKAKVILPFSNMGDLQKGKFSGEEKQRIMKGCVKWIKLMHDNGWVNFDIKRENFLGFRNDDGQMEVKGLDLDMARQVEESGLARPPGGTPEYMAPEVIAAIAHNISATKEEDLQLCNGYQADIFSLGKVLYFLEIGGMDRRFNFIRSKTEFDRNRYIEAWNNFDVINPLHVLVKAMMHPDPNLRPDIETVSETLGRIYDEAASRKEIKNRFRDALQPVEVEVGPAPEKIMTEKEQLIQDFLGNPKKLTEEEARELLTDDGSWLIRKDDGSLYLTYKSLQDSDVHSTPLLDSSLSSVKEILDYFEEEKILESKSYVE